MMSVAQTVKIKVKIHRKSGHEGPEGEEGYSSTLFNLCTRWEWVVGAMPWLLYHPPSQKETWYPLCGRLGGPQHQSG